MFLEELFFQIALVITVAAALSFLAYRLRQPLIIAYILTGAIAGPGALALARSGSVFESMSQIGVAFLLFTVGLGLNWRSVREVGGIAAITGIGQMLLTGLAVFGISIGLGFDPSTAGYLALALAFSSTIVIVKLLTDKEELDTLYGRISVGILLVQDFVAMLALLGLSAFGHGASVGAVLAMSLVKAGLLIPVFWFVASKIAPRLIAYAARSQELLFVFALAWCFLIASALAWLGFGLELGALVAGVTLAGTTFVQEAQARVRPLRDFFLIIFFIVLGTHIEFSQLYSVWPAIVALSVFTLFAKPLLVIPVMRALGYHPRTAFMTGTTMAQISEFSFIVLAAGVSLGHIPPSILPIAAAVGFISIAGSSYFIERNERLYERLRPLFRWMEPARAHVAVTAVKKAPRLLLFGFHRVGSAALGVLNDLTHPFLIVDFDPNVVRELTELGEPVMYGDVSDESFLEQVGAVHVPFIVSCIPDVAVSLSILVFLRARRYKGTVIVAVHTAAEAAQCYAAGAAYVIVPNILGGEKFRELLEAQGTAAKAWRLLGRKERAILESV